MSTEMPTLEQRLLEGYREQLRLYDEAAGIIAQAGRPADGPANKDWAHDLHAVLGEAAALDRAMAEDKVAWRDLDPPPGGELAALVNQIAERLSGLAQSINGHVTHLQACREKLLPEIDEFIQRRRMLEAYSKYGDRQAHVA